jgi:hypothetical protein
LKFSNENIYEISSSCYFDFCNDLSVVLPRVQQVRLNLCHRILLEFKVDPGSAPIIEKSDEINFFGPFPPGAELVEGRVQVMGTGPLPFWASVKDFSWLRRTPSPNWRAAGVYCEKRDVIEKDEKSI